MTKQITLPTFILVSCSGICGAQSEKPNIIFLLADDAGYADYQPYNELFNIPDNVRIKTPHVTQLAREGLMFTNAHSCGAVSQPSRYGIMSGMFSYRKAIEGTPIEKNEPFISSSARTLPKMLKQNGYQTAIVGKWHLDYAFQDKDDETKITLKKNQIDHYAPMPVTPNDYGFDHAVWLHKGISGAAWFIENRRISKLTGEIDYKDLYSENPNWPLHKRWQLQPYEQGDNVVEMDDEDKRKLGDVITD